MALHDGVSTIWLFMPGKLNLGGSMCACALASVRMCVRVWCACMCVYSPTIKTFFIIITIVRIVECTNLICPPSFSF